jgi:hypothetical protein
MEGACEGCPTAAIALHAGAIPYWRGIAAKAPSKDYRKSQQTPLGFLTVKK